MWWHVIWLKFASVSEGCTAFNVEELAKQQAELQSWKWGHYIPPIDL